MIEDSDYAERPEYAERPDCEEADGHIPTSVASLLKQIRDIGDRLARDGHPLARELFPAGTALAAAIVAMMTCNPVTGLPDKAAYERVLRRMVRTARREGHSLILLLLDSDALKAYNAKFGHPGGDELLRRVAALLIRGIREGDFAAHLHGDEFAVLLVGRTEAEGRAIAERLRVRMEADLPLGNLATLSFGMSVFPSEAGLADALHELTDQRLLVAKRLGGNTVIAA